MSANDKQRGGVHYKDGSTYQHWDFVHDAKLGYHDGNATKYVSRFHRKGTPGLDLTKAEHYLEKCMELGIKAPTDQAAASAALSRFVASNDLAPGASTALSYIVTGRYEEALGVVQNLIRINNEEG